MKRSNGEQQGVSQPARVCLSAAAVRADATREFPPLAAALADPHDQITPQAWVRNCQQKPAYMPAYLPGFTALQRAAVVGGAASATALWRYHSRSHGHWHACTWTANKSDKTAGAAPARPRWGRGHIGAHALRDTAHELRRSHGGGRRRRLRAAMAGGTHARGALPHALDLRAAVVGHAHVLPALAHPLQRGLQAEGALEPRAEPDCKGSKRAGRGSGQRWAPLRAQLRPHPTRRPA